MAGRKVVDPSGATWTVRHRWYPWRRALSFREAMTNEPTTEPATAPAEDTGESTEKEHGLVVQIVLAALGVLLWIGWTAGRVVVYAGAIVLFVVVSLAELALQLAVLPVVLLLRLIGVVRWPVQINRGGTHVRTSRADGYAAAAVLRDEVAADIERGALPTPDGVDAA